MGGIRCVVIFSLMNPAHEAPPSIFLALEKITDRYARVPI